MVGYSLSEVVILRPVVGKMSMLQLGTVIFGGTDGIIAYLRAHGLLASHKNCAR